MRIFEYQRALLHAKTLVADRFCTVVGSTNLDFRSFQFNAECNLVTLDDEVGERLAQAFEADLRRQPRGQARAVAQPRQAAPHGRPHGGYADAVPLSIEPQ